MGMHVGINVPLPVVRVLAIVYVMNTLATALPGERLREPIVYHVQEELPPGHIVGNLVQDTDLPSSHTPEELALFKYVFIPNPRGYEEMFNLTDDGMLLATARIDRDFLCPMKEECVLSLDVEISPILFFQIIKINVVILDIDDNIPQFEDSVMYVSLSESTPVGSVIPIPMAYDPDSPENGIDHYELRVKDANARTVFGLKANGDLHDLLGEIYLEILDHLDREEKSRYFLDLVARENNRIKREHDTLLVHVSVTDVNDNMPEFSQSKYTVTVPESIDVGTPLVRVMATDSDSGENSQIAYALSDRSMQSYGTVFTVDNRTGEVFIRQPLDYETETKYTLVVVASDRTQASLTGETVVSVEVTDVNDNPPKITVTSLGTDPANIQVAENGEPKAPLAHLSVMDPDQGLGGMVECILSDKRFTLHQIYANDFMLQTAEIMDHEQTTQLSVSITCKDRGEPYLVSEKLIHISVTDLNDNTPTFDHDEYHVKIPGSIAVGDDIFQASAIDLDSGLNGKVVYSIVNTDMGYLFSIGENSGIITAKVSIPGDVSWDFVIHVQASDLGDEHLSSVTKVIVSSDRNASCGERSSLSTSNAIFHIMENGPENMTVGQLRPHALHASCRQYNLLYPAELRNKFAMGPNGNIITRVSHDRESQDTYCFSVVFIDNCSNPQDIIIHFDNILITVDDQNDNAPVSIYPTPDNNTIVIDPIKGADDGTFLTHIQGLDIDRGENAQLVYSIVHPDKHPYLWLNPDSGELFLMGQTIPVSSSKVHVEVRIQDNGSPSLSTTTTLWIVPSQPMDKSRPMVASDNLVMVLGIAVPCGFLIVLAVVLIVVLLRRKCCCQRKKDRNHINPSVDIKIKLARAGSVTKEEKMDTICRELGLQMPKDVEGMYIGDEIPGYKAALDQLDYDADNKANLKMVANDQTTTMTYPPKAVSSRDSDSGCSADMSHSTSTTDSWAVTGHMWNRDHPDQLKPNPQSDHSDQHHDRRPYPQVDPVHINRSVPNNYVQLRPDGQHHHPRSHPKSDNNTYIRPDKVMKYGHISNGYQHDACSHRNSYNNSSCPGHVDGSWHSAPHLDYPVLREHHQQDRGNIEKDAVSQCLPDVHRSQSFSPGAAPNVPRGTVDYTDNLVPVVPRCKSHHDSYRDDSSSDSTTKALQNTPPKKKKIIYEAQV